MTDTSYHKLTYSDRPDAPLLGTQIQALATDLDAFIHVPAFASAGARNTAIPTPTAGRLCWRDDSGELEMYDGSAWVPLSPFGQVVSSTPTYGIVDSPKDGTIILGARYGFVNCDANGRVTIPFPDGGFPNACSTVIVCNGDAEGIASSLYTALVRSWSKTEVVVQYMYGSSSPLPNNTPTMTNYVAFGW